VEINRLEQLQELQDILSQANRELADHHWIVADRILGLVMNQLSEMIETELSMSQNIAKTETVENAAK